MVCDDPYPVASLSKKSHGYVPYGASLAASAASSTTSVWSDASSQASDESSTSTQTSDTESCDSDCHSGHTKPTAATLSTALPSEARRNSRRTSAGSRTACPPTLVRQSDRKVNFVDSLVGMLQPTGQAIFNL